MLDQSPISKEEYIKKKIFSSDFFSLKNTFINEEDSVLILYTCDDLQYTIQEYLKLEKNTVFFHSPTISKEILILTNLSSEHNSGKVIQREVRFVQEK